MSSLDIKFSEITDNNKEIVNKLDNISAKSDNAVLVENFRTLSTDLTKAINQNNVNNISILLGVIIGISIVNIFFQQFNKKI